MQSAPGRSSQRRELRKAKANFAVFEHQLDREAMLERNHIILEINNPEMGSAHRFFKLMQLLQLSKDRATFRSASEAIQ